MHAHVEVLVATMHQKDFSKIQEMNIQSDVIFSNQADHNGYEEFEFAPWKARMITTDQRGVGRNRNLALLYAKADIVLFGDDDMVYADGYSEHVIKAFEELPQADVIVFETDFEKHGEIYLQRRHQTAKLSLWKSWRYGTYAIAARKASLEKANLWFHMQFGGGCLYSSGEDSLFLMDCYRKKMKVYTYSYVLGRCKKDSSTWFEGYTEKYFRDKGSWLACALPRSCRFMATVLAVKWHGQNPEMGVLRKTGLMEQGITRFRGGAYEKTKSTDHQ